MYDLFKKKKRILFKDWSLYDAHHVVFKPTNFSEADLQAAQIYGHKKFYSWLQQMRKLVVGNVRGFFINLYTRHSNRIWKKKNKTFLKVLKPNRNADITIDYRGKLILP